MSSSRRQSSTSTAPDVHNTGPIRVGRSMSLSKTPAEMPQFMSFQPTDPDTLGVDGDTFWRYENTPPCELDSDELELLHYGWKRHVGDDTKPAIDVAQVIDVLDAVQLPLSPTARRMIVTRFERLGGRLLFSQLMPLAERLKTLHGLWVQALGDRQWDDELLEAFAAVSIPDEITPASMSLTAEVDTTANVFSSDMDVRPSKRKEINPDDILKRKANSALDLPALQLIAKQYQLSIDDLEGLIAVCNLDGDDKIDFYEFANMFLPSRNKHGASADDRVRLLSNTASTDGNNLKRVESRRMGAGSRADGPRESVVDFAGAVMKKRKEKLMKERAKRAARSSGSGTPLDLTETDEDADWGVEGEKSMLDMEGEAAHANLQRNFKFAALVDVPICPLHLRLPDDRPLISADSFSKGQKSNTSKTRAPRKRLSFLSRSVVGLDRSMRSKSISPGASPKAEASQKGARRSTNATNKLSSVASTPSFGNFPEPSESQETSPVRQRGDRESDTAGSPRSKPGSARERSTTPQKTKRPPRHLTAIDDAASQATASSHPSLQSTEYKAYRSKFARKVKQFR